MFTLDNDVNLLFMLKYIQIVLLVFLQPLFCFVSIINNLLVIITIKNKNKKRNFKETMYKYILMNALFNIVYCLITILKLVNTCIFFFVPSLCSNVYQTSSIILIIIFFMGNVFKTCSNVTYTFFSFSRLVSFAFDKNHTF